MVGNTDVHLVRILQYCKNVKTFRHKKIKDDKTIYPVRHYLLGSCLTLKAASKHCRVELCAALPPLICNIKSQIRVIKAATVVPFLSGHSFCKVAS
jgi:hypothetical protein